MQYGVWRVQFAFTKAKKRKQDFDEEVEDFYRRRKVTVFDNDEEEISNVFQVMKSLEKGISKARQNRQSRGPVINREQGKLWWGNAYQNWEDDQFKERFRINSETFNFILQTIEPYITKTPTNIVPDPIEPEKQLALTIYRLAHGVSFLVVGDLFGISKSLAIKTFNHVVRELVIHLYNGYIKLPTREGGLVTKLKGFIENYEFPCIGAWDGFHVYISSKLKNFYNFQHRYSISNMALVGYYKRIFDLTVGAPDSTHDARFLRNNGLYR